jgi:hypothetical protein
LHELKYKPAGDQLREFMKCDAFVRGIRGPVGSGKSVGSCIELFRRACAQEPVKDDAGNVIGPRKTRWAIVRNTNPQLKTTTIKTWLDWFPEDVWGKFKWSPPFTHHIKKGDLDAEFIFLALDKPEDVKKLLSLELTGAFINEAREVPKAIVDAATMRVGRYPSMKDGGPTWYGVIMDTNAPEEDHWWPIMNGETPLPDHITREEAAMLVKPADWEFFTQPAGMLAKLNSDGEVEGYVMNEDAENREHLTPDYYPKIIQGKTKSWIDVYVRNKLGTLVEGKAVYPDWDGARHLASEELLPVPNAPLVIGMDFGLTPAAVFCQQFRGRWLVLRELVAFDMGASRFAKQVRQFLATEFPENPRYTIWGDPAGDYRAQTDERTPFAILRAEGLKALSAPTNDPALRIDAVTSCLTRMLDHKAGLLIDPRCTYLSKGFDGGYHYKKLNVSGGERFADTPEKNNKYSHVHDALQYALCGGGEGRALTSTNQGEKKVTTMTATRNPFDRRKTKKRRRGLFG